MKFDLFVLPFSIGTVVLLVIILYKFAAWIFALPKGDKKKIGRGIFSLKIFTASWEVFLESLLHRKIFRVNPLLGYMHASLAFGWLLLIVFGNIESRFYHSGSFELPYMAIFFDFFVPDKSKLPHAGLFVFLMDIILLVVLSGVLLAVIKRFYSRLFGMKKTSQLKTGDKFALVSLWFIFPLRFFAESFTSAIHGSGGFLTGSAGKFFALFLPVADLAYPAWWAYSLALGVFFIALPFSRYMHIPAEVLLIFLRKFGVKTEKKNTSFAEIEIHSCPRCGICVDKCQLTTALNTNDTQAVYFLRSLRQNTLAEKSAFNCLLCGRCQEYCPVGIQISDQRMNKRDELVKIEPATFDYLPDAKPVLAEVIYFAGCMTHLTPKIKIAMLSILKAAGVNYHFMDEDGSVCCGRPMMLTGKVEPARKLIEYNKKTIENSGAKLLVTSCPICYRVFKEDYNLNITVLHHTQYILQLMNQKKIEVTHTGKTVVYHDPCELGRASGIYNEPRMALRKIAKLQHNEFEKENALCCGGSLASITLTYYDKDKIRKDAAAKLTANNPDAVITACPLCKKAISFGTETTVVDIAEMVAEAMGKKCIGGKVKTACV